MVAASSWRPCDPERVQTTEQRLLVALAAVLDMGGASALSIVRVDDALDCELLIATWVDSRRDVAGLAVRSYDLAMEDRWYRIVQVHLGDAKLVDCWTRIEAPTPRETDRRVKSALVGTVA